MKKYSKFAMMFFAGALALGFTSCSDDDDPTDTENTISTAEMQTVAQTYIDDVVYPTYNALKTNADELASACATLYSNAKAGTMTQAHIDAACEAFKNARREWERSEAFLYGAATDNEIDPHIDSWPLDQDQLVQALNDADVIKGINGENPAKFVYEENGDFDSVLGFHGLEFVLFRDGQNRTVEALKANETFEGMTSVTGLNELAFAAAVSADIQNMTTLLAYGWTENSTYGSWLTTNAKWTLDGTSYAGLSSQHIGYGSYLLAATTSTGYFSTWQETMENILVGGCSNICQEVYTQKLGQAYRVATNQGEDEDAGDYIESPYSKRSFVDYQDNIYSIKNTLYGTRDINATTPVTNSLMTIMTKYNYSGLSALQSALNSAISALESAKNSGVAFVDNPGATQVKTCIDAINELDDQLNEAGKWFRNLSVTK